MPKQTVWRRQLRRMTNEDVYMASKTSVDSIDRTVPPTINWHEPRGMFQGLIFNDIRHPLYFRFSQDRFELQCKGFSLNATFVGCWD